MKNEKVKWKEIEYPRYISTDIGQANFWLERLVGELRNGFRETDFKKKRPISRMADGEYVDFVRGGLATYFGYLNRCAVGSGIFDIGLGNDGKPVVEEVGGRKILVSVVAVYRDYDHEVGFKSPMRKMLVNNDQLYDMGVNLSKELAYIKYLTDGDFENGRKVTHVYRFKLLVGELSLEFEPLFDAEFDKIDAEAAKCKFFLEWRDANTDAGIPSRVAALVEKGWNVTSSCSAIIRNDRGGKKVCSFYITFLVKKGSDDEANLISVSRSAGLETKHISMYSGTTSQRMNGELEDEENVGIDVRGFHMRDETVLMVAVDSFVKNLPVRAGKEPSEARSE